MENEVKKKKFNGIGIWKFLNKIPAGTMFVPLVISAIISTLTIEFNLGAPSGSTGFGNGVTLWQYLGNPMQDLFGSTGQMLLIGLMLFCTGTMIKPHDFVEVGKRGIWIILARLIPAYVISAIVYLVCGLNGFIGLDFITLTCILTSANAALYMGIVQPYADESDLGTFPIMLICSMPLLPFIFISSFGEGSTSITQKIMQIFSLLIPFLLGFLLGNLDNKIREVFKGGNTIILPFLGFQFGSTINLTKLFDAQVLLSVLIATLLFWAVTMIIPYIVDRFALKRPGYASIGSSSLAGVALSIPAMFLGFSFNGETYTQDMISRSVAVLAIVLLITNILSPFFTKWSMNFYFKTHQKEKMEEPKRIFEASHPELLLAVYDEKGNYRTHHHNHNYFKNMFHIKSHKENEDENNENK